MPRSSEPETSDDRRMPNEVKMIIFGVIAFICLIIFLIFLFGSWYMVGAGERVIVLTFRNPSEHIQGPGFHFKIPIVQSIVRMNVRTQTITFDNKQGTGDNSEYSSLFAASSDLQDTQIATVVNFHIEEKDVLQIYNQYGDMHSYQINILEPLIRDTVKSVSATYTAEDLVKKRAEYNDKVAEVLKQRFEGKSALFERVNIVNFQFSDEFTKAIERKVTAEQNALTEKNNLERVKYEADQRIAQAEGEAKAIQIQVAAINQQGGASYVELQRIQRWNGQYPMVMGASSPIVDLRGVSGYYATSTGGSSIPINSTI
jgi:regulator of protease activity HflC (stomatin/prohibitin superfamily)